MAEVKPPPYTTIARMGVFPLYTQHTTDIGIRVEIERSFSEGIQYHATDVANGAQLFSSELVPLSLSAKKPIYNYAGALLSTITNEFAMRLTFVGHAPETNETQFTIESRTSWGITLSLSFRDNVSGQMQEFTLERPAMEPAHAVITRTSDEIQIAHIYRHRPTLGTSRSYDISVSPGVDAALMFSLCVCYDRVIERRKD